MFKIDQSDSYTWPVKVEVPMSGGKFEQHTFDVKFKRVSQARLKEINKLGELGEINDVDLCKEILVGWSGVTDGKDEIPFSEEAKDKLLDVALVAKSVVISFYESLSGAKRKN